MTVLFALGLGTGICCGIWALISSIKVLGLITWVGFAGCTAYFASGKHGFDGVKTAILSTLSGMLSAFIAMYITKTLSNSVTVSIIMTGVISATMCWQAKDKQLWFIPGAFIGCFTTFGASSMGINILSIDAIHVLISLICGAILALSCDKLGEYIFAKFGNKE